MLRGNCPFFVAMGMTLLLCSDNAWGQSVDPKNLFLDCAVKITTTSTEPDSSITLDAVFHYMVDENTGNFLSYTDKKNEYETMCASPQDDTCVTNKKTIYKKSFNDTSKYIYTDYIVIDRSNGRYYSLTGNLDKENNSYISFVTRGACKVGSDRRIKTQRF